MYLRLMKFIAVSLLLSCLLDLFMALDGCAYTFSLMPPSGDPDFCGSYSASLIHNFLSNLLGNNLIALVIALPFLLMIGIFGSNVILVGLTFSYIWLRRSIAEGESLPKGSFILHLFVYILSFIAMKLTVFDPLFEGYLLS